MSKPWQSSRPRASRTGLAWGRWKAQPEDLVQYELVKQLRAARVLVIHIPNQRKYKSHAEAEHYRKMGVFKGASDLFLPTPPPALVGYLGAFLEVKTETGRATPEQRAFLAEMSEIGYATAICKGTDACVAQLQTWGYLPL